MKLLGPLERPTTARSPVRAQAGFSPPVGPVIKGGASDARAGRRPGPLTEEELFHAYRHTRRSP